MENIEQSEVPKELTQIVDELNAVDVEQGLTDEPEAHGEPEAHDNVERLEMDEKTADFTAKMGLASIEGTLKLVLHSRFEFSESAKAEALEKFAPMLVKYGLLLPDVIMQYKPELEAAKAAFTLAKDGYNNVVELKKEDAALLVESTEIASDQPNEGEQNETVAA